MPDLTVNGVAIDDGFAEAFPMVATRLVITAPTLGWARTAGRAMTGFATSVIGCGCEAAVEGDLDPAVTPDGRPGVSVLVFAMDAKGLEEQVVNRTGQCVLTSPGSACFAGLEDGKTFRLGGALRWFGDGWQASKVLDGRRYWRVPVMDGEFVIKERAAFTDQAVGGGNLLLMGRGFDAVLAAAERAAAAVAALPGVIAPFPGGVVRSGSKVGSKYKALFASTNEAYCPTLKGAVDSALGPEETAVLEIVIDGLTREAVAGAMRAALHAAAAEGASAAGLTRIGAGNYGGNLGPHHFHLKDLMG